MTPPDALPAPSAPKHPAERRARRRHVELLLIEGRPVGDVEATVAAMFSCSTRTVRQDVRRVEAKWAAEDKEHIDGVRVRALRRLERLTGKMEAAGDFRGAALATAAHARLLGLPETPETVAGSRLITISINVPGLARGRDARTGEMLPPIPHPGPARAPVAFLLPEHASGERLELPVVEDDGEAEADDDGDEGGS